MTIQILNWEGRHSTACAMFDLAEICYPSIPRADRDFAVRFISNRNKGFELGTQYAKTGSDICGFTMVSKGVSDGLTNIIGGVHPTQRNKGVGTALLKQTLNYLQTLPDINTTQTKSFQSNIESCRFLEKHGFHVVDNIHWSRRSVASPFDDWAQQKTAHIQNSSLRFVRGDEFKSIRPDWARAWWKLEINALKDVPSTIPFEPQPFERWRPQQELPFRDCTRTLLALDGIEPVGAIVLGNSIDNGIININHTGVASSHRRKGLSVALKVKAFEFAAQLGAHTVQTQNHQSNPILGLNIKLGFVTHDVMVDYLKPLSGHVSPTA